MSLKPGDFVLKVRTQGQGVWDPITSLHSVHTTTTLERVYIMQPWASPGDDKRKREMGIPWCNASEFIESERGLTWCLDDPEEVAALKVVLGLG